MRINYFLNELNMLISVDGTTQGLNSIDIARNRLKTKLGDKCNPYIKIMINEHSSVQDTFSFIPPYYYSQVPLRAKLVRL